MTSPLLEQQPAQTAQRTLKVEVRNSTLDSIAEVDDYTGLTATVVSCDVGNFTLKVPSDSRAAQAMSFSGGIRILRKGALFLAGPITDMQVDTVRLEDRRVVEVLTVTGVDDNDLLAGRVALPKPGATDGGPYDQDYDDHSGPFETVARGFVDRNLGPSAIAERRIPDLVLEDDVGRGVSVRGRPDRFDMLLPFLQDLRAGTGVTFRIVQVGSTRVLRFYEPRDRSADVVFGLSRSNLAGYTYKTARASANYLYAGGQGDLSARLVRVGSDPDGIAALGGVGLGRREGFLDERSAPDAAYLDQKIGTELVARGTASGLSLSVMEAPDATYGVDYELDDIVSVRLKPYPGAPLDQAPPTITDRVSKLTLTVAANGQVTMTPTTATDGANLSGVNLVGLLRRVQRGIAQLQTRS